VTRHQLACGKEGALADKDDLGDAQSRLDNARFREMMNRRKTADAEYAYLPRYVPTGNFTPATFDLVMAGLGAAILIAVGFINVLWP
jgi:hypothetical protein